MVSETNGYGKIVLDIDIKSHYIYTQDRGKGGETLMVKEIAGVKMYNIKDLAESLGLTERTIRGWYQKNKITGGVKLGKEWFISEANLQRFLNAEGDVKPTMAKPGRKRKGG